MKHNKLIILFLFIVQNSFCQNKLSQFYNQNFMECDSGSAKFMRKIIFDSSKQIYQISDFKIDGKRHSLGYCKKFPDTWYYNRESNFIEYYENENKKREINYNDGQAIGEFKKWYLNGKLKQIGNQIGNDYNNYKIIEAFDSLGNQQVTNGNGLLIDYYGNGQIEFNGHYENGFMEGEWNGFYDNGSKYFVENYVKNNLEFGTSFDKDSLMKTSQLGGLHNTQNKGTYYTKVEENAGFQGGSKALGRFLQKNLRYPKDAQKKRKQGKVFSSFVIDKDGSISDVQVLKGIWPSLDEEAVRVIYLMDGNWIPGKLRGKPVKSRFNLPISFLLD